MIRNTNAYLEKLKELDLREPEFAYANDLQFVKHAQMY